MYVLIKPKKAKRMIRYSRICCVVESLVIIFQNQNSMSDNSFSIKELISLEHRKNHGDRKSDTLNILEIYEVPNNLFLEKQKCQTLNENKNE